MATLARKLEVMNAANTMNALSVNELKKRSDSLIENIGALRFSIARIEYLTAHNDALREMLADARVVVDAHGTKALVKRIDKLLKETNELTVQA